MGELSQLRHATRAGRVCDEGEFVVDRDTITGRGQLVDGSMSVSHFTAVESELILSLRTGTGAADTIGVDALHAWIGIFEWDGTDYTPAAASVDDPTRWASADAAYDTAIFEWDHPGEAGHEGWQKVAGRDYALWLLWIGDSGGSPVPPKLWAATAATLDSLTEPRTNGLLPAQTQPPVAPISGAFFGMDSRRFQALMKR